MDLKVVHRSKFPGNIEVVVAEDLPGNELYAFNWNDAHAYACWQNPPGEQARFNWTEDGYPVKHKPWYFYVVEREFSLWLVAKAWENSEPLKKLRDAV